MDILSILFLNPEECVREEEPACFTDLNLNQIVNRIVAPKLGYDLFPFFYTPLRDADTVRYRQEIMRDLENEALSSHLKAFEKSMNDMHRDHSLSRKLEHRYNREGWFLEAAGIYCEAVGRLARDLSAADIKSRGLIAFRRYLEDYTRSGRYASFLDEIKKISEGLRAVQYCLLIKGNQVKVRKYRSETDYSMEVENAFKKFKQGAAKDYRMTISAGAGTNHIEAKILDLVARHYPGIFSDLDVFCQTYVNFQDQTILAFEREIQFYISYLDYISGLRRAGLRFCYPKVSDTVKEIYGQEAFDLALAHKLTGEGSPVVTNDFHLKGEERVLVVSGPNQGGKTTFARMFGQLHYLAGIGCPVPGVDARLYLPDDIFTHFEREENIKSLHGKLQDDLIRVHAILEKATSDSIVIMNEIFTSATFKDSVFLGKKVMERLFGLDLLGIYVTFIPELSSLSGKTVSMVCATAPEDPTLRTYKVVRKPADGLAYAISIARKRRLTYDCIKERIGR